MNKSDGQWLDFGTIFGTRNNTLLSDCISSTPLQIRIPMRKGASSNDWYYESSVTFYGGLIPTDTTNISIDTGNDGISDFINTTVFTTTETIDLNITASHNFLSTCSADSNGLCNLPFNITSYSSKILAISAINITYDEYPVLTNCSEGGTQTIIFHNYYEANQSIANGTLDVTFDILDSHGNQTNNYSFEFSANETHSICIYPTWDSYQVDMMAEYDATGFAQRTYYLDNETIDNTTTDINLYLLDDGDASILIVYVRDSSDQLQANITVEQVKYFVGSGEEITVAILMTDANGKATTYVDLDSTWYKWILIKDGVTERTYSAGIISDTSASPEELTLYLAATEYEYFHYIDELSHECVEDRTNERITCMVTDGSGLMTEFCLRVWRWEATGYVDIGTNCSTTSGTNVSYALTSTENKTFAYRLFAEFPASSYLVTTGYMSFLAELVIYGLTGVFVAMLVVMTMAFVGLWSPAASIVGGTVGLIVSAWLNLIVLSPVIVVGIVICAGIMAIRGRW